MNTSPTHRLASAGMLCAAMLGCYDPTEGVVDTGTAPARDVATLTVAETDVEVVLDANNTDVKWTGSNSAGLTPYGYFYGLTGKAILDGSSEALKHIEIEFDMHEVKSMDSGLTKKLHYKGFFEVDTYPTSTFVSTEIREGARDGDPPNTSHVIQGNFQLRDVTKSIEIPVKIDVTEKQLKLVSQFKLNRKDYGVVYSDSAGDALIRDDILLNVSIEADR